jgi:type IV pilus assembly protein PilB
MKLRRGPAEDAPEVASRAAPAVPRTTPGASAVPRLGELLLERSLVTDGQLAQGLLEQAASGGRLGTALVKLGLLDERALARVLAEQQGLPLVDLRSDVPEPEALAALSESVARSLNAVPIRKTAGGLLIAVADSEEGDARHVLQQAVEGPVVLVIAPRSDIERTINNSYRALSGVEDQIRHFEAGVTARPTVDTHLTEQLDDNAPVVKVFDLLLLQAVRDRASDIHIEPLGTAIRVRYRIDGALHEVSRLPAAMGPALVSRIKIMAGMNIVERRRSQDGQIEANADGRPLDVRVSTTLTVFGEKCVLRLLDKSRSLKRMSDLGMPADSYERFRELARNPYGMVVVAGPTGSGKTTTLYATLNELNSSERNLMTIEDPVEYVFPTINQIQIHEQAGVTFANGLRSILRQDPDVILVGEMRDVETSHIAVQAALTGHFVLAARGGRSTTRTPNLQALQGALPTDRRRARLLRTRDRQDQALLLPRCGVQLLLADGLRRSHRRVRAPDGDRGVARAHGRKRNTPDPARAGDPRRDAAHARRGSSARRQRRHHHRRDPPRRLPGLGALGCPSTATTR